MSVTTSKHDDSLFEILKECRTLPNFLDTVFGFLKRRTDFYVISEGETVPVGLPNGAAEAVVRRTFFKWQEPDENKEILKCAPLKGKEVTQEFTSSDSYNGAVNEQYSWSQSINDIDMIYKIPEGTTTKELQVLIQSQNIKIRLKEKELLNGQFCHKVKHNDAIWSIDRNKLEIHLDKTKEIWWDCLVTSETRLDISKIDCSRPFEELSQEAQAKIEELQWNQERKRLGLPTSQEIELEGKLKKAWNADGSPFTGPFDPKSVIMN